jgi:hypothetical protein
VVESAAAACWSPRAAAAWALEKLMGAFAAKAEAGSSAAITMQKTKRMTKPPFSVVTLTREGMFGCSARRR